MSRRYYKAVEQYLATHAPTTLRSEPDKQRLIREHAQRVAKHVEEASQDLTMGRFGRPSRELRNELERVVFPYEMTRSLPPEREQMHGLGDADANFIMLSDSLRNARTPMSLRTEAAYDKFQWDNDRPVFRIDGSIAATWDEVLEDHQRQADAVNTLRSLSGRQLAIVDRMVRADRVPEGVVPAPGTVGEVSWADVAHLVDRERAAGSFEIPTGPPQAPTGLELDPYSAEGMRYELQVELYREANPPSTFEAGREVAPGLLDRDGFPSIDANLLRHADLQAVAVEFRDNPDTATRQAAYILSRVAASDTEHIGNLATYAPSGVGDGGRITSQRLIDVIKDEVLWGTFNTPDERPEVRPFGERRGIENVRNHDDLHMLESLDFSRDMLQLREYEAEQAALAGGPSGSRASGSMGEPTILRELPLRPADIHAQAANGPAPAPGPSGMTI